jgi:hypothetical protein
MSHSVPSARQPSPPRRKSAPELVHAQYWRALARIAKGEPADRAAAFAEARRLIGIAVALRRRITSQDAPSVAAPPAERQERTGGEPRIPQTL